MGYKCPYASVFLYPLGKFLAIYRERQIPYVFTFMWILRNSTEDHGGGRGEKEKLQRGKEANHKRILKNENKLRIDGGGREGKVGDGH